MHEHKKPKKKLTKQQRTNDLAWDLCEVVRGYKKIDGDLEVALKKALPEARILIAMKTSVLTGR